VDLISHKRVLHGVVGGLELILVDAGERQQAARVDTHSLDGEALSGEMSTLDEEAFADVVGDSGEEFDGDFELLTGDDFTAHLAAFEDSGAGDGSKVDVELEGNLTDILDEEVLGDGLVVGDLAEVKLRGGEVVRDEAGVAGDGHVVIGASIN
jgi:hypothetical protein